MLNISVERFGDAKEVEIEFCGLSGQKVSLNLGPLNDEQCKLLSFEFRAALRQLLPENENPETQLACVCDRLNSWAREQSVEECEDPYENLNLRDLVDRLWCKTNMKLFG